MHARAAELGVWGGNAHMSWGRQREGDGPQKRSERKRIGGNMFGRGKGTPQDVCWPRIPARKPPERFCTMLSAHMPSSGRGGVFTLGGEVVTVANGDSGDTGQAEIQKSELDGTS